MAGGGLRRDEKNRIGDVYHGVLYQRGYGLAPHFHDYSDIHGLGFLDGMTSLFRFAMPLVKTGMRYLGGQAINTVADIARDALAGRDIKESAVRHATEVADDIFAKAPDAILEALGNKRRGLKRKPVIQQSAGKLVSAARIKRPRQSGNIVGKGLMIKYPALEKLL